MPIFSDNFNRANEDLDVSADWTDDTTPGLDYKIVSNEVRVITANASQLSAWVNSVSTRTNMIVAATIRLGTNQPAGGVVGRRTAAGTYYSAELSQVGRVLQIRLLSAGVSSLLVGGSVVHDVGTNYLITFTVNGTSLSATSVLDSVSTTNSSITAAGSGGIILYSANAIDTVFADTFSISDVIVPAPALPTPTLPVAGGPLGAAFSFSDEPYPSYKSQLYLWNLLTGGRFF